MPARRRKPGRPSSAWESAGKNSSSRKGRRSPTCCARPGPTRGNVLSLSMASLWRKSVVLRPGTIVSVVPRPQRERDKSVLGETVGMFQDDPLFDEMVEAGRAYREAEQAARDAENQGS